MEVMFSWKRLLIGSLSCISSVPPSQGTFSAYLHGLAGGVQGRYRYHTPIPMFLATNTNITNTKGGGVGSKGSV
jgi:hypothetical protein